MFKKKILFPVLLVGMSLLTTFISSCSFININPTATSPSSSSSSYEEGLANIEEAWHLIEERYVEPDVVDPEALSQAAIEAMLEVLDDPYTSYLDKDTYELSQGGVSGSYEGIGATIAEEDDQIKIVAPIEGSPADLAGIMAGDIVLAVDGRSTDDLSLTELVLFVRGTGGTTVTLTVIHEGETTPVDIAVVRAEIELKSVLWEMREDIAYLRITHFSERTASEMKEAISGINNSDATGIVLDLRSNPGGLLQAVVSATSHFLDDGIVLDVVDRDGNHSSSKVESSVAKTELPVIVLVNEFSASGSEVMSGALQDYGRATVAGKQTFGKGSVNIMNRLSNGGAIYITISRWLTPNGNLIEGEGITPDIELELHGDEAVEWAIDYLHQNK